MKCAVKGCMPMLAAALSLMLAACFATPSASPSAASSSSKTSATPERKVDNMLTLKSDTLYQTIAGFGTTGCWWAQDVGGWQQDKVDKIVNLLFSREKGIGLNIYRFEVGGGGVNNSADPWRRAETFESAPGQYDWSRDANAVNVMKKAVAAGVDDVMFFANTPPGRMTVSGKTTGADDGGPNLKHGMEGEFARYLVDIALHFRDSGVPVKYISPLNEPQWNWKDSNSQEGCHYDLDQIVTVADALTGELARRSPDIRPSLVDSGKWLDEEYTVEICKRLAEDPLAGPALDHFAVHSYWSNDTGKHSVMLLLKEAGVSLPLWQTEWCQMEAGRDLGMDAALTLVETVHEDMTITDCSAWISWLAVSCYDYKDGLVYVDLDTKNVFESKRLWALGNYSRFVLPGYRRIGLDGCPENLLVSAYESPDGKTVALVAINSGSAAMKASPAPRRFTSMDAYETSECHSLDCVFRGAPGEYAFPAKSVTTLVLHK